MPINRRFLASTALAFTLGAVPAAALTVRPSADSGDTSQSLPLVKVQMSVSDAQARLEAAMAELTDAQANGGDVEGAKAKVSAAQADLDAAVKAEAQAAPPAPEQPVEEAPAPAPEPEAAPAPEPEAQAAPVEEAPAAEEPAPQPEPEAAPAEEPAPAAEAPAPAEEPAAEAAPAEEPAPAAEEPAPQPEAAPEPEQPAAEAPAEQAVPAEKPAAEAPAAEEPAAAAEQPTTESQGEPAPEAAPAEGQQSDATAPAADANADASAETSTEAAPAEQKSAAEQDAEAEAAAKATAESNEEVSPEATLPVEGGAPVLDSAKEAPAPADGSQTAEQPADGEAVPAQTEASAEPAAAPTSDAEAQASLAAEPIVAPNPLQEEGQRLQARPRQRPDTSEGQVVQEVGNRFIIQFNNQTFVRGDDDQRLRGRGDVYYDELPRGRTREVITRRNGVQVVTIRNRYGEIIQRSKILPDGREILLAYVPENERADRRRPWRDPGRDLPPLRINIPISQYVLDATVADEGDYYDFLDEPPVERVERIYSVDEVKYSARIRDKVRRIDMDTLTFETGSANIPRDQVDDLGGVADAMARILEQNPGETFLIEGHTDAVGSDQSNLILSDERAETVANALSSVYGIPPENLATQGYGERYLKVRTQGAERLNRRVTIRRITPLVSPVASAQ